ncbi:MAG TPA: DUF2695 domain-containing protein [Longimicrobium sp.]|nr:DUF2695 domain-containing protein [Longimicrobium sp.]
MTEADLVEALHGFLDRAYPGIEIRAEPFADDPSRTALSFRHDLFAGLYPLQRYHYLVHHIPRDFFDRHLARTVWFELAPGESPEDLRYPDPELVEEIAPDVMRVLQGSGFLRALDLAFCPDPPALPARCHGDFRVSRALLLEHGFAPDDDFDVFHVLMARGAYCDCEILYNAMEDSRLKARYWEARAKGQLPPDPHAGREI